MSATDRELVEGVLSGDEDAFASLVARHRPSLLRVARAIVSSAALAEELVQDSWIAALEHLEGFEHRSSFKTWITAIVTHRARNLAVREQRTTTALESEDGPSVPRERFTPGGWSWVTPPTRWAPDLPETFVRREQARAALTHALEALPPNQRAVVTLRDVEGLSSEEVCEALSLSAANQRVLLHRGRSRLRTLLEAYADGI